MFILLIGLSLFVHLYLPSPNMNLKVLMTLAACFLFCLSAFAAAEPVHQGRAATAPLPHIPMGDAGPVAEPAPSSSVDVVAVPVPAKDSTVRTEQRVRRSISSTRPSRGLRQADERPRTRGWVGWVALGLGLVTLGLQAAVILIGIYLWYFASGLLLLALATGILAIIFGALSIDDRRSKAFTPGQVGFILAVFSFVWPLAALAIFLLMT